MKRIITIDGAHIHIRKIGMLSKPSRIAQSRENVLYCVVHASILSKHWFIKLGLDAIPTA